MENKVNYKVKLKAGDKVQVVAGNAKGKSGVILEVNKLTERATVEGVNMVTKHVKPTQQQPEGAIVKKEAAIHLSSLALLDPKTGKPTKVGRKEDANGKLKRYSKDSKQFID
jgi:large subunit ribosomal protein L24